MKAQDFLNAGLSHMQDRAATYDKPTGERSMAATVGAFKSVCGVSITEEQGWLFMGLLKMVRSQQGEFKADNYEDEAAYAALRGECAFSSRATVKHPFTVPASEPFAEKIKAIELQMAYGDTASDIRAEVADNDGWIEWAGGECPVDHGADVSVKFADGDVIRDKWPEGWGWGHDDDTYTDIIAYRIHKAGE